MPIGSTAWGVVLPVEQTNLLLNSSFERGTSGVAAIQGATLGSASNKQQFGAWSCFVVPGSNGTSGGAFGTWTAGNGTDYTVSAYVNGQNGIPYMIGVGDSNGVNLVGSAAFTGGGTWQRYSYSYTEASGAVRRVVIRKTSGNNQGTYYADGVDAVAGSITTHIDGDQEGCTWLGAPHASQSTRSGQSRAGGSVVALADLGFTVADQPGIGMPPVENSAQSFAVVPGAEFQRQRAGVRTFTLTSYVSGTSRADLHITRDRIIDALKIDAVTPQQPCRFLYTGGLGTVQIDAVYDAGLEYGKPGGFTEDVTVRFVAYDPYWRSTTQQGTSLASRNYLGSANFLVWRDPTGVWGTFGQNGTTVQYNVSAPIVHDLLWSNGTLFFSGIWGSVGGTVFPTIGMHANGAFGTLVGGTLGGGNNAFTMARNPDGTVFVGGNFIVAGGTAARQVAQWTSGGWGTLVGGTVQSGQSVFKMLYLPTGTLAVAGNFATVAGTVAQMIALWTTAGWGTLAGGTLRNDTGGVRALAYAPSQGNLFAGGAFGTAAGTVANNIAVWNNGAWGTLAGGVLGAGSFVYTIAIDESQIVYAAGHYELAGGGSAHNIAGWNGVQWQALGSGIGSAFTSAFNVVEARSIVPLGDGRLFTSGVQWGGFSGPTPIPDNMAIWNGAAFTPLDIDLQGPDGTIRGALGAGTLYIGGDFFGTARAASVITYANTGAAEAYPILRMRNTSTGTARVYQILNTATDDNIYFNLALQPGETATLDLTPGARSFSSDFRGNIFSSILPGSNIATWKLLPGNNTISYFCDNDTMQNDLYFTPRHWSADGGTVYA